MTKSIGHTKEFWNNFRFLLRHAVQAKIYRYQKFAENPEKYCGMSITDTPYKPERDDDPSIKITSGLNIIGLIYIILNSESIF